MLDTDCQSVMHILLKTVTQCLIKSFRITAGFQHQASPSPAWEQDCWSDIGRERENSREGLGTGRSFGDGVRNRTSSHYRYRISRMALWLSVEEAASQCGAVGSTPHLRRGHMLRGRQARAPQRPKPQSPSPAPQEEPPQWDACTLQLEWPPFAAAR